MRWWLWFHLHFCALLKPHNEFMRLICCCCCKNRHIHQANTIIIYLSNDSGKRQRPTQLRALTISYTNSHRHNNGLAAATKSSSFVKPYEICYACNTVRFIERLWPYLYTYSKCRRVQKQRAKLTNLCVWRGVAPVFYRLKKIRAAPQCAACLSGF